MKTDLRDIGLTQQQASQITGMAQARVSEALAAKPGSTPNRRTLDLLIAAWPEMSADARERVRGRLAEMRGGAPDE
jgi:hypothetical protein